MALPVDRVVQPVLMAWELAVLVIRLALSHPIMVETTVAFVVDQEVEVHLPLVVLQQVVYQVQVVVTGPLLLLAVHL
ncbi:MAG: hypothetical protein EBT27_07350 [Betaproteobacteria bacterium]|nr:hypothetical protein [Betaproteobacteria bacterium]